jgi:hypothetical protein
MAVQEVNEQVLEHIKLTHTEEDRKHGIHNELSTKERLIIGELTEVSHIRDQRTCESSLMIQRTLDSKTSAMEHNLDFVDFYRKVEQNSGVMLDSDIAPTHWRVQQLDTNHRR